MSQKLVPKKKVIVTLMTSAVVSNCENRKILHNKAPVSQLGSYVDGHPQEQWLGLPSSAWHLFPVLKTVFHWLHQAIIEKKYWLFARFDKVHIQPITLMIFLIVKNRH